MKRPTPVTLVSAGVCNPFEIRSKLGDIPAQEASSVHDRELDLVLSQFPGGQLLEKRRDFFLIQFPLPSEAVVFALRLHKAIQTVFHSMEFQIQDSIGIHVGPVISVSEPQIGGAESVFGFPVDLAIFLMEIAGPGQTFMSRFPYDYSKRIHQGEKIEGVEEVSWLHHGLFVVREIDDPMEICEVGERGFGSFGSPPAQDLSEYWRMRRLPTRRTYEKVFHQRECRGHGETPRI